MDKGDHSDDSDCGLPDLSHLLRRPDSSCPISPGDIVFAKFKKLYWPALVRAVYPRQKKISIWYCDDPGKTFKLPLKNVSSFYDSEMRAKIEKDITEAGCAQAFEGLTHHADKYLIRKAEGRNDDPLKFFDQTYPFFLIENLLKKDPNADVSSFKIPPLYISHEKKAVAEKKTRITVCQSDDSEAVSVDSDSEKETEENSEGGKRSEIAYLWKTSDPSVIEYTDKILKFILAGKADTHLKKVLSKSIPSYFYDVYEQAAKRGETDLTSVSLTGPIDDNRKIGELVNYLTSLFSNLTWSNNTKLHKKASTKFPFLSKIEEAQYTASVWLPESIVYAIAKINCVSLPEAMSLFDESSYSKKKLIEKITSHSAAEIGTKNSYDTISSPLKKLCLISPTAPKSNSEKLSEFSSNKKSRMTKCNISEALDRVYEVAKTKEECDMNCDTLLPQKNATRNAKVAKSNCLVSKSISLSDISVTDNETKVCEIDKTLDVLSSQYVRRSPRKISKNVESSCQSKAKKITSDVYNLKEFHIDLGCKSDEIKEESSSNSATCLSPVKISKKRKKLESNCNTKFNKAIRSVHNIQDTTNEDKEHVSNKIAEKSSLKSSIIHKRTSEISKSRQDAESEKNIEINPMKSYQIIKSTHSISQTSNEECLSDLKIRLKCNAVSPKRTSKKKRKPKI